MDKNDANNLNRFINAQEPIYKAALSELRQGRKQTHWMWFIFPQAAGLGRSSISRHFAIKSVEEARAYLQHPVLGTRLIECTEILLGIENKAAHSIFGYPDNLKLRSCMTLFAGVSEPGSVFDGLLEKYYNGEACQRTRVFLEEHT